MVIIWDLEWLTIFIPIISKYQIWFVELFVGKKMIHKWSQNICIHMSLEDEIDIWTLFIASWQFYLHIHYFLFTIHNKKLCISFLVMLNMFRITRQIWGIWKLRPAYNPETPNLGQNRWFFVPCDLEIWWMTLENNRASTLCCFKLCATFHSHWWIQTGVTVRKRPIWVKFDDFLSHVTFKFDGWPWKRIEHFFYSTSTFMHHFGAIGVSKLELESGNAQFGSNSTIFRAVWPWNLTDDLEKQ